MITLIGSRCTASNRFSRGVLIRRFLLGNLKITIHVCVCFYLCKKISWFDCAEYRVYSAESRHETLGCWLRKAVLWQLFSVGSCLFRCRIRVFSAGTTKVSCFREFFLIDIVLFCRRVAQPWQSTKDVLARLDTQRVMTLEVGGSNPPPPTTFFMKVV